MTGVHYRKCESAERDGIAFNAIWVPEGFTLVEPEPCDPAYMAALFHLGNKMGRKSIPWSKVPPG